MDEAVEIIDALLALVAHDWRIRALDAEYDLGQAQHTIAQLKAINDDLVARMGDLQRELNDKRAQDRYSYEWIARDEERKKMWYETYSERLAYKRSNQGFKGMTST